MITRDVLASQLRNYLQHRMTRAELVDWAERAMMEDEFDDHDLETIRDITSRLGLADVREFGLAWEDCEGYLSRPSALGAMPGQFEIVEDCGRTSRVPSTAS